MSIMQTREIITNWTNHEFYQNAVVLGLDIGIEGIGVWLRKGPECLFARTFEIPPPDSAPLRDRRLKRSARRARKSEKHRGFFEDVVKAGERDAGFGLHLFAVRVQRFRQFADAAFSFFPHNGNGKWSNKLSLDKPA